MNDQYTMLAKKAKQVRVLLLQTAFSAKSGHIGSALSTVDIITALYFKILKLQPKNSLWGGRDIFILSKGHGVLGLYATLCLRGFFPKSVLENYFKDGSVLAAHPVIRAVPGLEASTGSLGHGLPMGLGMAYAYRNDGKSNRVVVMLSDGECDEGSTWEAVLAAGHLQMDNLVAVVDYNKFQGFGSVTEVLGLEPFADKWKAFNWNVLEIDGHNMKKIDQAFSKAAASKKRPTVIIAHTVKGKGVSFMENTLDWHYLNLTPELLEQAIGGLQ